jgi:hypothetical protein
MGVDGYDASNTSTVLIPLFCKPVPLDSEQAGPTASPNAVAIRVLFEAKDTWQTKSAAGLLFELRFVRIDHYRLTAADPDAPLRILEEGADIITARAFRKKG